MPQWLIQIDPLTTAFTIRRAGDWREFREHEPQPETMGKIHRGFDVLLLGLRVCHDQIRRDLADISTSTDEVLYGLLKFMGIDFPARVALPGIRTALKAQIKRPKTCLHHAARQVFGNKPGIEGIRRMEVRLQPALSDLAQEGQQDLVWLEQQGVIIERDMLRSTLAEPGELR